MAKPELKITAKKLTKGRSKLTVELPGEVKGKVAFSGQRTGDQVEVVVDVTVGSFVFHAACFAAPADVTRLGTSLIDAAKK